MSKPYPTTDRRHSTWRPRLIALAALCLVGTLAVAQPEPHVFYLSLGDSMADGGRPTPPDNDPAPEIQDYADQLFSHFASGPWPAELALEKRACGGETTETMIHGGPHCADPKPQLDRAVEFIEAHQGSIAFITISIGGNDILECLLPFDQTCFQTVGSQVEANLDHILATLRAATGPEVPIVGMTYHNPSLGLWTRLPFRLLIARLSNAFLVDFNQTLRSAYAAWGATVADVEAAFSTTDFERIGFLPVNVVRICQWTWMCGPELDQHPNNEGYRIVAGEFARALSEQLSNNQ